MKLIFEPRSHAASDWLNEFLHGDQTHEDEEGNEVTNPGTPGPPVVIEPEPEPEPEPDPEPETTQGSDSMIVEPLTREKLEALLGANPTSVSGSDAVIDGDQADNKNDEIHGAGDNQTLRGHSGNDFLHAGRTPENQGGADHYGEPVYVETSPTSSSPKQENEDKLYGGTGHDVLVGGYGEDLLDGGSGNDYLFGDGLSLPDPSTRPAYSVWDGNDVLNGGPGNDYLHGGGGRFNILNGGPGNDHLESGEDSGARFNILDGGPGNDTLKSAGYNDVLIGGPGRDTFDVFDDGEGDHVKIVDFQNGADRIKIGGFDYGGYASESFSAFYNLAREAGIQWDMDWIATELEDGVILQLQDDDTLTIIGVRPSDLQFEFVGEDVFIV